MARQLRSRALTLVEVLVVICVCAVLVLVVVRVFRRPRSVAVRNRPRSVAARNMCGMKLSGIGKTMMIYANDYEDELPRAGGPSTQWGATPNWTGNSRFQAFNVGADGSGGTASMTSCLFLLVKYAEVTPRTFICKGDKGVTEFELSRVRGLPRNFKLIDGWDFGPTPQKHVSYAYQMSFGEYGLKVSSDPGLAVAADRNPWVDSPFAKARPFSKFKPDIPPHNGRNAQARAGNCLAHDGDGQQVLFLDIHVEFANRSYCALDDDNIYTSWDGDDKIRGTPPVPCESQPAGAADSLLVNDPPVP